MRVGLPTQPELLAQVTPGMFARVHFVIGEARKMTVPAQAVVRRGEVAGVYVQAADGRLSLRQVRLGETRQEDIGEEKELDKEYPGQKEGDAKGGMFQQVGGEFSELGEPVAADPQGGQDHEERKREERDDQTRQRKRHPRGKAFF